jgi:hypothetical protein
MLSLEIGSYTDILGASWRVLGENPKTAILIVGCLTGHNNVDERAVIVILAVKKQRSVTPELSQFGL